jgi:hypothetical protein
MPRPARPWAFTMPVGHARAGLRDPLRPACV